MALNFLNDGYFAGKVGIGTTSPGARLEVKGSDGYLKFDSNGDNGFIKSDFNLDLYADDTANNSSGYSNIRFFTYGASEKMRITSTGNVGIGTTAPFGTAANRTVLSVNGTTDVSLNVGTGGSQRAYLYGSSTYADLGTIGSLPLVFSPNNTERMRISSAGAIKFNAYDSTNNTGTPTYILGTDASGNVVKVLGSNIPTAAPATPGSLVATIVGETIEIAFAESSTSDIGYYQVWSSDDGGDYGLIAQITPTDFSSTMTVVDTTFVTGGTMSYRVFAVKNGVYSSPGTVSKAYTVPALSVTDMTVVNLNTAYYIQYEKPTTRFIDHIEIWMDSQTTSAALLRSNAVLVYSGQNTSYMRNVNTSSNFHQFWVEVVTS